MQNLLLILIQLILLAALFYVAARIFLAYRKDKKRLGSLRELTKGFIIGLITDTLDTWGIGSFATTTTLFKWTDFIDDDVRLPGTLTVGHVIPVIVEALFFITAVKVELTTLIPMTTAAILGALTGTRLTAKWNTRLVQRVLGLLLIIAAGIMIFRFFANPGSTNALHVTGLTLPWLIAGVCFNFLLGILMTMGLGNYAPELVFFSLAGVNPLIALPVMMLDAAMILTTSAGNFIHGNRVHWIGLLGLIIGGTLGVVFAATIVTSVNLQIFKIATIIIVIYTGGMLIWESITKTKIKRP